MIYSSGTLLDGKVRYRQMTAGHRSGLEPVLLAAAIPARSGDAVLEAGTGAGAGLLCLGHRVTGISGLGIERDPDLALLAAENFTANGQTAIKALVADVAHLPLNGRFDHGFANPPWRSLHDTASPDLGRQRAHRAAPGLFGIWTTALAHCLRPGGTLSFIVPAATLDDCLASMAQAACGACRIIPFWPLAGRPAKLVIVQARRHVRGPVRLAPGLILHDRNGFTPEADSVLRHGLALPT